MQDELRTRRKEGPRSLYYSDNRVGIKSDDLDCIVDTTFLRFVTGPLWDQKKRYDLKPCNVTELINESGYFEIDHPDSSSTIRISSKNIQFYVPGPKYAGVNQSYIEIEKPSKYVSKFKSFLSKFKLW